MLLPPKRRSLRDVRIVGAYFAGSLGGALLTALSAWLASGFTEPLGATSRVVLFALAAALIVLVKRGPLAGRLALPENRRQIPAEVFGASLIRGALRFGFEMGTGVRTYVPTAAPYLLLAGLLLARPTLGAALLVGLGFALGRAVPMVVQMASIASGEGPSEFFLKRTREYEPALVIVLVLAGAGMLIWR